MVVVVSATASWEEVVGMVKIPPPRTSASGDSGALVITTGAIRDEVWGRRRVVESGWLYPLVEEGGCRWSSSTVLGGWKPRVC